MRNFLFYYIFFNKEDKLFLYDLIDMSLERMWKLQEILSRSNDPWKDQRGGYSEAFKWWRKLRILIVMLYKSLQLKDICEKDDSSLPLGLDEIREQIYISLQFRKAHCSITYRDMNYKLGKFWRQINGNFNSFL